MNSVIAGFLVRLGFTFDKDQLRRFEGTVDRVGVGMKNLAKLGIGAGVAITAAIAKANAEVNTLYKLSNQTGAGVRGIRTLASAVRAVGGNVEDVSAAFSNLAHNIKFLNFEPYIKSLGVSLRDANGETRDLTEVMLDLGKVLREMPQEQSKQVADVLGISPIYESLMRDDFAAELQRTKEVMGDLNAVIGDSYKSSHRFTNEFVRLGEVSKATATAIGAGLTDFFELDKKLAQVVDGVAKASVDFIDWQKKILSESKSISDWADRSIFTPAKEAYLDFMTKKRQSPAEFLEGLFKDREDQTEPRTEVKTADDAKTVINERLMETRGMRNNNPTNLRAAPNAVRKDKDGFAVFATPEAGYEAAARQLKGYGNAGLDTVEKIISKWAPDSENDTETYIRTVVQSMRSKGHDVLKDTVLDLSEPDVLKALLDSMINVEVGAGAEGYFTGRPYENIVDLQSKNEWKSAAAGASKPEKERPNVTVNQNVTITGVNDPQKIRRAIVDSATEIRDASSQIF